MQHFKCLCAWTLLATLWTFLGVRVGQDYESQTEFSRYKSFGWAVVPQEKAGASSWGSPFTTKRIQAAVESFLVKNGYAKSSDGKPDFLVNVHLTAVKMVDVDRSWEGGPGRRYLGDSAFETVIIEYDEGTVIIDFLDAATKTLFWRGTGTRRIDYSSSPQKIADTTNRWVSEILKQYPPKAKVSRQPPAGCSTPPNQEMPAAPQV
jgi:Domain of unknown function (DUF4136)